MDNNLYLSDFFPFSPHESPGIFYFLIDVLFPFSAQVGMFFDFFFHVTF